jgi:RNA polymerase sigma factor (sigma-70 family)
MIVRAHTKTSDDAPIVYVVDDDDDVREAIGDLLLSVGLRARLFESVTQFTETVHANPSGCIVLDVRLPGRSGLEFHHDLVSAGIRLPVIFISGHADVPMSVRAMKAGAFEFFTKPLRDQDLLDAIQAALAEDRRRHAEAESLRTLRDAFRSLTSREREVMRLVVAGKLNKQIASEIGLTEATVKLHRARAMHKMQVRTLAALVRAADRLADDTARWRKS